MFKNPKISERGSNLILEMYNQFLMDKHLPKIPERGKIF